MNIRPRTLRDGRTVWRCEFSLGRDLATGKPRRVVETCEGTRREAERFWVRRLAELRSQQDAFLRPSKEPLADYLARWLDGRRRDLRPTTWTSYEVMVRRYLTPVLGGTRLRDLAPAAVQRMLDALAEEGQVSARTVAYVRTVLRIALQDAVRLGTLAANPVDRTRPPKQTPRRVDAFTPEELAALFRAADGTRVANLLPFLAYSGLRRGEALALRWEDVDFAAATVSVRRSRVSAGGRVYDQEPKTEAGVRTVTLPAQALDALRRQREMRAADMRAALARGWRYRNGGWVFATRTGKPLEPSRVSRDFRRVRDAAGVRALPLHALRHTAVSLQIAAGVPLEIISKRIGHRQVGITADRYGHLLPQADREAAAKLSAYLARRETP